MQHASTTCTIANVAYYFLPLIDSNERYNVIAPYKPTKITRNVKGYKPITNDVHII